MRCPSDRGETSQKARAIEFQYGQGLFRALHRQHEKDKKPHYDQYRSSIFDTFLCRLI